MFKDQIINVVKQAVSLGPAREETLTLALLCEGPFGSGLISCGCSCADFL